MGLFGGKKAPTINIPAPPKLPTAEELYAQALGYARREQPLGFGARESALSDLNLGNAYFDRFQPSSFEQALGNQYFQNIMPDLERSIKHNLSLSGTINSPLLADQIAKARGQVGFDVGSYLSNIANQRALTSLNSRLNISPESIINPFIETGMNQANKQADLSYQGALMQAQADYQNAMQKYNQSNAKRALIGSVLGGVAGSFSGPGGAAMGSSIGGTLAGGGAAQSPVSFGDALSIYQAFSPSQPGFARAGFNGYGKNTPFGVYNTGSTSILPGKVPMGMSQPV